MKAQFIKALIKKMVATRNFLPLKDRDGNLRIDDNINILAKNSFGSNIIVELLDGDKLTGAEITARLQENSRNLAQDNSGIAHYFLAVFVFESTPEADKLTAIVAGQFQNVMGKKYLNCLTVNLSAHSVNRQYTFPKTDFGLAKTITRLFSDGITGEIANSAIEELVLQKEQEYQIQFKEKTPVFTFALIGLNIIIAVLLYLYSLKSGTNYNQLLIDFGAKENFRILSGEYWRFFSPIFLHANTIHLFINCYSLYAVGVSVEKIFGRFKFITVYFAAGILGNIASFMFSSNPGVGASGAIFGLLGALLYFGINKPALFASHFGYNIILTIFINLAYGFSRTGIDNFAHIGGLLGGFLTSGMVRKPEKSSWYVNRYLYFTLTVIMVYSGLIYGFNNPQSKIAVKMNELAKLDKAQNWVQAELKAKEILALKPGDTNIKASLLWTLVKAQALSGNYHEAVENAKNLKTIDPPNGHYLLGLLYFDLKQYDLAKEELLEAKKAGARNKMIEKLLGDINQLMK